MSDDHPSHATLLALYAAQCRKAAVRRERAKERKFLRSRPILTSAHLQTLQPK